MLERIASGRLSREASASPDGGARWQPLEAHPPFASELAAKAKRRRDIAATVVGAGKPQVAPAGPSGVVLSLSDGSPPGVLAIPIEGEKPRRWPKLALGCVAMLVLVLAGGGLYWLYANRPLEPIALVVESAEVEDIDREAVGSPELYDEMIRVRVRTVAGARVSVSSSRDAVAGADGVATVLYPIGRTREPTVEIEVRVWAQQDGRVREALERRTVERPDRIWLRGEVAECSTRSCALGVEADGTLTVSGVDATTRITLGESTATGQAPDPSEDVLTALSPDALFGEAPSSIDLPLRFELADGTRFDGTYPVGVWTARRVVFERFVAVEEGAVEVPVEARGAAILWIGGVGAGRSPVDMRLIGEAAAVGNIGRVAIVTASPRRRSCGRYGEGQAARAVYAEQRNVQVVLYDRRRGRVSRRRTITAPRVECPRNITIEPGTGDIDGGHSDVEPEAIETWLNRL